MNQTILSPVCYSINHSKTNQMKQKAFKHMATVLFIGLFIIVSSSVKAQFKIGAHLGVPSGDVSDYYTTALGADVYYMFGTDPNGFLKLGVASGFMNYFGDEVDIEGYDTKFDNAQFIPVAGALRVQLLKILTVGPDIGYGFGISDGMDDGFYWKGVIGVNLFDFLEVDAYFHGITIDESSFGSVGLGVLFEF